MQAPTAPPDPALAQTALPELTPSLPPQPPALTALKASISPLPVLSPNTTA